MTATAEPPRTAVEAPEQTQQTRPPLSRAEGVELLGGVHGSGYKEGAALVRRGDGQMVHLGPLMYGLLEAVDGERDNEQLAEALSQKLGRRLGAEHIERIAQKLAAQGLLAGSEHRAPPKRNPLLALRWKVLVTNPEITRRLTAPFTFLFRPWVMWPVLACCAGVLVRPVPQGGGVGHFGGVPQPWAAAAGVRARGRLGRVPRARSRRGLPLRRGDAGWDGDGALPGVAGVLHRRHRHLPPAPARPAPGRSRRPVLQRGRRGGHDGDLARWRQDALLLLVALQVLQMVKQLSPVIRADGYHILSDATGVPDLYSTRAHHAAPAPPAPPRALGADGARPAAGDGVGADRRAGPDQPVARRDPAAAELATTAFDSGRIILSDPHQAEPRRDPRPGGVGRAPVGADPPRARELARGPEDRAHVRGKGPQVERGQPARRTA